MRCIMSQKSQVLFIFCCVIFAFQSVINLLVLELNGPVCSEKMGI
jgi:hypothetical protein